MLESKHKRFINKYKNLVTDLNEDFIPLFTLYPSFIENTEADTVSISSYVIPNNHSIDVSTINEFNVSINSILKNHIIDYKPLFFKENFQVKFHNNFYSLNTIFFKEANGIVYLNKEFLIKYLAELNADLVIITRYKNKSLLIEKQDDYYVEDDFSIRQIIPLNKAHRVDISSKRGKGLTVNHIEVIKI